MALRLFIFLCGVVYCAGAGGASGGGGSSSADVEGSDSVVILQPPKPLRLTCNTTGAIWLKDGQKVESSPPPEEGAPRVQVFENGTLSINPSEEEDVATYKCKPASNDNTITYYKVVTLSYSKLDKSTTAIEGEHLVLTCNVEGNPTPEVTWMKGNTTLVPSDRISFKTEEDGPENTTLIVTPVNVDDRGVYMCLIDNTDGERTYNTTTSVRVKDLYAALWPFLGIVVEVVVLCTVIFCYERRRSNLECDESDGESKSGA